LVSTVSGVFQRVGKIAGMAARFFGLRLAVGEQLVDLFGERADLAGEILADPRLLTRADHRNFAAHASKRPQAINRLQRGQDQQAGAKDRKAPEQGRAQLLELLVDQLPRLSDLKSPAHLGAGDDRVALGDAQRLLRSRTRRCCRRAVLSRCAEAVCATDGPTATGRGRSRLPRR
jgi:hypothetical protein